MALISLVSVSPHSQVLLSSPGVVQVGFFVTVHSPHVCVCSSVAFVVNVTFPASDLLPASSSAYTESVYSVAAFKSATVKEVSVASNVAISLSPFIN